MFLFAVLYLVEGTLGVAHAQLPLAKGGKWVLTGTMQSVRAQHTATLLANGQVLVAGGTGVNGLSQYSGVVYPIRDIVGEFKK